MRWMADVVVVVVVVFFFWERGERGERGGYGEDVEGERFLFFSVLIELDACVVRNVKKGLFPMQDAVHTLRASFSYPVRACVRARVDTRGVVSAIRLLFFRFGAKKKRTSVEWRFYFPCVKS